jgi:hypothetical protein
MQKIFGVFIKPFFCMVGQITFPVFSAVLCRIDITLFSFDAFVSFIGFFLHDSDLQVMLERSHKRFYLVKFLRASKKKEWILFYFSLFDRINRIFRIFFPGLPEERLEIPTAY